MKKIMLVAALATVTACSETAPAPEPEATEEVAAAPAEILAADGQPAPGMYKITRADGTVLMEDVKADGTYSTTQDGKVVETGKWVQKSPEEYCYTKDEEGAVEECNVEGIDDKGVWTSKDPEGNVVTVERAPA